ncbi:Tox-REase-5 domain-containing protein [Mycobacteroides abscessus]|uniref:Tox-REase-5 domain-containing protein n=1 Tax=Mycobacteroides abscessus TaxID=36809 RepID=UPI001F47D8BA|nr:Tox-REase-5 domain-containing protein [Mycobacteroides abscessus]
MVDIPDIEKWDVPTLQQVKDAALAAGHSLHKLGEGLDGTKKSLDHWGGESAEAYHGEHGKVMVEVQDQHGETVKVADLMDIAIEDVRWCINELKDARAAPEALGMTINRDGSVTDPDAGKSKDEHVNAERAKVRANAEERLKALLVKATATDVETANALRAAVGDKPLPVPQGAPHSDPSVALAELQRVTDQAVVDKMAEIRGIQKQIDQNVVAASIAGQGTPAFDAANARVHQLNAQLATKIGELGNIPDYSKANPLALSAGSGGFLLNRNENGQKYQVTGRLVNGTGQIFDQSKSTYYDFKDGKLVGTRVMDPGVVKADNELLWNAVLGAVGAPDAALALKAGGKAVTEGFGALLGREGAGALGGISADNVIPKALAAAELRADAASANLGHHLPPAPIVDHPLPPASTVDHPMPPPASVDHPLPPASVDHPTPATVGHPTDTFNPSQGQHYVSGDPHHPGGWPPGTPSETWAKGDTDPGWRYINRGPDKDWMDYQSQITGIERTADGRIPEYTRINPDTGAPVNFDGHTWRGGQEVFLDAKDGYAKLATEPGKPWTDGMATGLVKEVNSQIQALPPNAILEIHVSDPVGATAIRNLLASRRIFDATVIYTPKAP